MISNSKGIFTSQSGAPPGTTVQEASQMNPRDQVEKAWKVEGFSVLTKPPKWDLKKKGEKTPMTHFHVFFGGEIEIS